MSSPPTWRPPAFSTDSVVKTHSFFYRSFRLRFKAIVFKQIICKRPCCAQSWGRGSRFLSTSRYQRTLGSASKHIPVLSRLPIINKHGGLGTFTHLVANSSASKEDQLELIRFGKKRKQISATTKTRYLMPCHLPFEKTSGQQK